MSTPEDDVKATFKDLDALAGKVGEAVPEKGFKPSAPAHDTAVPREGVAPAPRPEPSKQSGRSLDDLYKIQEEEQKARQQKDTQDKTQNEKEANIQWIKKLEHLSDDPLWKLFVSLLKSADQAGETMGHATQYILTTALLKNDKIKAMAGSELDGLQKTSTNELSKNMPMLANLTNHLTQLMAQIGEFKQNQQKMQNLKGALGSAGEAESAALQNTGRARANGTDATETLGTGLPQTPGAGAAKPSQETGAPSQVTDESPKNTGPSR